MLKNHNHSEYPSAIKDKNLINPIYDKHVKKTQNSTPVSVGL